MKGDFDALLNADSGKPATTKQPPVLLDLRKSGSFKPQSSQDSAASFATAPSSSSDVVSEAAHSTNSSSALGSTLARQSSPLKPGLAAANPSAGYQLLQKHSSNGAAEHSTAAGASEAGASEPMSAFEDEHPDSRETTEMQSSELGPNSSSALNGSASEVQPMKTNVDPLGLQKGQHTDANTQHDDASAGLSQHALAAESRSPVETASMPQQESSMQDAQAQKPRQADNGDERQGSAAGLLNSLSLSATAQQSELHDSVSAGDSHPLDSHPPDAMVISPKLSGAEKQDVAEDLARLHDPLQSSSHEALSNSNAKVLEPSGKAAASQGQTTTDHSRTSRPQVSKGDASLHATSDKASEQQSTRVPEQAPSTASSERSASAQPQGSAALGFEQPEKAAGQDRAAEPREQYEDAQSQLSFSRGPEASEELPVSTLGARWLSGVLPDQESSAADDSPAAEAEAEAAPHNDGEAKPDEDFVHGQQGTVCLPTFCQTFGPMLAMQCCYHPATFVNKNSSSNQSYVISAHHDREAVQPWVYSVTCLLLSGPPMCLRAEVKCYTCRQRA